MKLAIVLLCFLLAKTLDAQCGPKLTELSVCLKDLYDEKKLQDQLHDKQMMEEDLAACFRAAGCQRNSPDTDWTAHLSKRIIEKLEYFGYHIEGFNEENVLKFLDATVTCIAELNKELFPKVERCVQGKDKSLAGYKVPDLFGDGGLEEREAYMAMLEYQLEMQDTIAGISNSGEKRQTSNVRNDLVKDVYDESICPRQTRQLARTCIEGVLDAWTPDSQRCKTPEAILFDQAEKKEDFCADRAACFADLGLECALKKDTLHEQVCKCALREARRLFYEYIDKLKACVRAESGGITITEPDDKGFRRRMKSFSIETMKQVCYEQQKTQMTDPCGRDLHVRDQEKVKDKSVSTLDELRDIFFGGGGDY